MSLYQCNNLSLDYGMDAVVDSHLENEFGDELGVGDEAANWTGVKGEGGDSEASKSEDEHMDVEDDFKSLDHRVVVPDDILDVVAEAMGYQHMFTKRTSPWEMVEWAEGELDSFSIDEDKIDRVYYIYGFDDGVADRNYTLLARMRYGRRKAYFVLNAGCDFTGFDCQGGGEIYVTFDPQIFLKSIVSSEHRPHDIWTAMVDDGLSVEEPTPFELLPERLWSSAPLLKYLCHQTVYNHQDTLAPVAAKALPKILADSVDDFIKARITRDHYNDCEDQL